MGNNHTFLLPNGYYQYDGQNTAMNYINSPNYISFTQGDINYRKGVRNGYFVVDRELYEYGFVNAEGVGWVNVYKLIN